MSALAPGPIRIDFDLVREAFDRTSVGLVVISPDGVFRQANRAFCEMIGYSREEVEGQSFRQITHPDDIARDEEHLRAIRAGGDLPPTVDKRFLRKNGTEGG